MQEGGGRKSGVPLEGIGKTGESEKALPPLLYAGGGKLSRRGNARDEYPAGRSRVRTTHTRDYCKSKQFPYGAPAEFWRARGIDGRGRKEAPRRKARGAPTYGDSPP